MIRMSVVAKKRSHQSSHLLQEEGLLQGLRVGTHLILNSELSEEMHVLSKHEILLGRGA